MQNTQIDIQGVTGATGLLDDEKILFTKLLAVYNNRVNNNFKRGKYYKDEHSAINLGISVPQKFADCLNTSIGGAKKAVDMLAERSIFDGFVVNGENNDILDNIAMENDFKLSYEMAVPSELIYGCGFGAVTGGENTKIPVIRYYDARNAAALWNFDKHRILAGFCVADYKYEVDGRTVASRLVLHTDNKLVEITNVNGWGVTHREEHKAGRPLMESMSYLPTSDRPFGKSRITPTVMGVTDEMQREILRTAITSELFSAPMRAILGRGKEDLMTSEEQLYYQRLGLIEKDDEGDMPQLQEFKQASMTPHIDMMRNLASRMSAETSIPVNSLGIIHDQPASAEALKASMEDLCMKAESLNTCNKRALSNLARLCFAVYHNKSYDDIEDKEKNVSVCFRNPFTPSIAQTTDAAIKMCSVNPWFAATEEFWELTGGNEEQRKRIMAEKRKAQAEIFMSQNLPQIQYANEIEEKTTLKEEQNQPAENQEV